jgi:anti-sigma regulatory factor (Ser/Thr protein kinase)
VSATGQLPDGAVRLRLPADGERLGTARIFGAACARQFGADDEVAEDMRLAVSEACVMVTQAAQQPAAAVVITLTPTPDGIAAEISSDGDDQAGDTSSGEVSALGAGDGGRRPSDQDVDGWGAELLQAIVGDLAIERGPSGQCTVSFTVPLASGELNGEMAGLS